MYCYLESTKNFENSKKMNKSVEKWAKEPVENATGFTEQTRAIYASAAEEAEKEHIDGLLRPQIIP